MWHVGGTAGNADSSTIKSPPPLGRLTARASSGSAVDVTTMADRYDGDCKDLIPDDVEDAVATDANAVLVPSAC
jgi:hypothetical protein